MSETPMPDHFLKKLCVVMVGLGYICLSLVAVFSDKWDSPQVYWWRVRTF